MGHTIIDCRTFIKTTRGIIPLVLGGSNNCYDIVRGKDFKLRELRERYWSVLLDLVELPEEEILAKFENLIPDNSIECWVYNGKWLNGAQAQKWFARGVKDAAPLEDILSSNPGIGHLFLALMSYASSERLLERRVKTTDELEGWLDEARETVKEHEGYHIFMSFSDLRRGERLRPVRKTEVRGPLVVQKRGYGYVAVFNKMDGHMTVQYVKDARAAIIYPSAEAAAEAMGDLIGRFGLELKSVTHKMMAPRPYAVQCMSGAYAGKYLKKTVRNGLMYTSFVNQAQKFVSEKDAAAKIAALQGRFDSAQYLTPIYIEGQFYDSQLAVQGQ